MCWLAVKQPGMNTERLLYELGRIVKLNDARQWGQPVRDYPGEGTLEVEGVSDDEAAAAMDGIDTHWRQRVEIIDTPKLAD